MVCVVSVSGQLCWKLVCKVLISGVRVVVSCVCGVGEWCVWCWSGGCIMLVRKRLTHGLPVVFRVQSVVCVFL